MTQAVVTDPCPAIALQQLLRLPADALVAIWRDLPAAGLRELDGEYAGFLPIEGVPEEALQQNVRLLYRESSSVGYWIGKAYHSDDGESGEGHNVFRTAAREEGGYGYRRNGRYRTYVGDSLVDGKPSLIMDYTPFDHMPGRTGLIDEVRRFAPGLYLGTATTPTEGGGRTEPGGCFVLSGPVSAYVGLDDPTAELP